MEDHLEEIATLTQKLVDFVEEFYPGYSGLKELLACPDLHQKAVKAISGVLEHFQPGHIVSDECTGHILRLIQLSDTIKTGLRAVRSKPNSKQNIVFRLMEVCYKSLPKVK